MCLCRTFAQLIHTYMYVRKLADRRANNLLCTYWSTDVLGRSPLQCHSCQRRTSSEIPEPSIAIEKRLNQAFQKTIPKVARPTALESAVLLFSVIRRKHSAMRVLESVGGSWGQEVCINCSWGLEAYERLHYNWRRRVWTTRWALCHPFSCYVSVVSYSALHSFKLLFETKQRSFLSACSSFLSGPHRNYTFCLARITSVFRFFEFQHSFTE